MKDKTNTPNSKRYHVFIEGIEDELIDVMYGAGMTDGFAVFETDSLTDQASLFDAMATNYLTASDVPEEELKLFLNEFRIHDEMMKTLSKRGKLFISNDYWVVRITDTHHHLTPKQYPAVAALKKTLDAGDANDILCLPSLDSGLTASGLNVIFLEEPCYGIKEPNGAQFDTIITKQSGIKKTPIHFDLVDKPSIKYLDDFIVFAGKRIHVFEELLDHHNSTAESVLKKTNTRCLFIVNNTDKNKALFVESANQTIVLKD